MLWLARIQKALSSDTTVFMNSEGGILQKANESFACSMIRRHRRNENDAAMKLIASFLAFDKLSDSYLECA